MGVSPRLIKTIILLIYLLAFAFCDLPVHCRKNAIKGEWVFRIDLQTFQPSLGNPKTSCSHGFPDKIDETLGDKDYSFRNYKDIIVTLNGDYKVYEEGVEIGKWTPVFDEGFIAEFHGGQYTAFSKYYKDPTTSVYKSNCDKTMIGWYIPNYSNKMKNWSCFFGFKTKIKASFAKALIQVKSFLKKTKALKERSVEMFYRYDPVFLETSSKNKIMSMNYDDQKDLVDEINSSNLTWKADFNTYFKGMTFAQVAERVGATTQFKKKLTSQIMSKSSSKKTSKIKSKNKTPPNNSGREVDSKDLKDQNQVNKYQNISLDQIDSNKMSLNWDWRNVGGINYVSPVRTQGNCGSCYAISTIVALETRLRIRTLNKDQTIFSEQYILSCSPYTEGCQGGFPILVGKFASEFDLIPQACFPYQESHNVDCSKRCKNPFQKRRYFVQDYGYLGGFYGATTEENMMKEIRANGPIPGNIVVPWSFNYYRSGVYMYDHNIKSNTGKINKQSMFERDLDFLTVAHSTVLVGWGEENGIKYWIGMNTWGSSFGENGFYKILRGENECNVETMGDYFRIGFEDL